MGVTPKRDWLFVKNCQSRLSAVKKTFLRLKLSYQSENGTTHHAQVYGSNLSKLTFKLPLYWTQSFIL
jgi:hypothetical protein